MIEVVGNLWEYVADCRVITTNGSVKRDGTCVMGRGCAAEAKQRWPQLPRQLGEWLANSVPKIGQTPHRFEFGSEIIYSFPVKHQWFESADLELIERSARELVQHINHMRFRVVVMPRPGCGNGGLSWTDVRPMLASLLDDRFHVITFGRR